MNADWSRIRALFDAALAQPSGERQAWLERETPGEDGIRAEVESLLAAHEDHEELSRSGLEEAPAGSAEWLTGEFCGPYRLDRLIGQGGMAWVYEGSRVAGDFHQRVAVKVLPAVFGEALNERFRQEKQILAGLSHPGIARLLDGGVNDSGVSYLAMEYVEGEPITSYAASRQLSHQDRIRLFLKVCEAVEFAHAQRVIHRDIKPANILVTAGGQPKLLDFGIARLLDQEGAAHATLWRAHTPGYASPEQLRGEAAGPASDVFQLGVLLAELLTGKKPGADLAAIVSQAQSQDSGDRYRSAALLAEDLNRYLEGLPVHANRIALLGRAVKLARRYRGRLVSTVLVLAVGGAAVFYQAHLRGQERIRRANDMFHMIVQEGISLQLHVARNQPETASEVWRRLRDSVEQLQRDDPGNPMVRELLANCYLSLGQLAWSRYMPSLMDPDAALESDERVGEALRGADSPVALRLALNARMSGSEILIEKGRGLDAFTEVRQLLLAAEARRKDDARVRTLNFQADLASFYDMLSDRLGANMSWPEESAESPQWRTGLAAWHAYRASDAIAAMLYRDALATSEPDPVHGPTVALVKLQLGRLEIQAGMRAQGMRTLREAVNGFETSGWTKPADVRIAAIHSRFAKAAEDEGNFSEALGERSQALEILEAHFQANPQSLYYRERLGEGRIALARVLARLGRHDEALRDGRSGLQLLEENADRPRAAAVTLDLTAQRLLTAEPASLRDAAKALSYARKAVDQTGGQMPSYIETLAFAQEASGCHEEARQSAMEAVRGYKRVLAILQAVFDPQRYPEPARTFRELQGQLDGFAW